MAFRRREPATPMCSLLRRQASRSRDSSRSRTQPLGRGEWQARRVRSPWPQRLSSWLGWVHSGGIAETRPDGIAERQPLLRQLSEPELLRLAGSGQRYLLSREEDHVPRYLESGKPGSSCWRWPAPPTIWQDLRDLLGAREILTAYCMTETTASTTCTLPEGPNSQLLTTNGCMKFAGVGRRPRAARHSCAVQDHRPDHGARPAAGRVGRTRRARPHRDKGLLQEGRRIASSVHTRMDGCTPATSA